MHEKCLAARRPARPCPLLANNMFAFCGTMARMCKCAHVADEAPCMGRQHTAEANASPAAGRAGCGD